MTTRFVPKETAERRSNGIYIDGIGWHQCGLPLESHDGMIHTMAMGDNNHAVLVRDDRIGVTTRVQTVLPMYMQGIGQSGRTHRLAASEQDLGEGTYAGLQLTSDSHGDRVRLLFRLIRPVTS